METAIIIFLVVLLGGSSTAAIKEHKQLADAHQQAVALGTTIAEEKGALADQVAAQGREDAARQDKQADESRKAQIRGTYHVATTQALKQVPPDVTAALSFNTLAIGADDPLSATTQAQGEALAAATEARQAQMIADLQAQLKQAQDGIVVKDQAIQQAVKDKLSDTARMGDLAQQAAVKDSKLQDATTEKTDLLSKFNLLTAKYGRWIFWSCVVGAILFVLFHLGLFAHLGTVKQLNTLTVAHAAAQQTIATQAATIDAHVATIKTLAAAP